MRLHSFFRSFPAKKVHSHQLILITVGNLLVTLFLCVCLTKCWHKPIITLLWALPIEFFIFRFHPIKIDLQSYYVKVFTYSFTICTCRHSSTICKISTNSNPSSVSEENAVKVECRNFWVHFKMALAAKSHYWKEGLKKWHPV